MALCESVVYIFFVGEDISAITDHVIMRTSGVPGISQINGFGVQSTLACDSEQAFDGNTTTRMFLLDLIPAQRFDGTRDSFIELLGSGIVMVVTQVGTDHYERFRSSPEEVEHLTDLCRRGVSYDEGHKTELAQDFLEKGEVDFETMFLPMSCIQKVNMRESKGLGYSLLIDRNDSQWCSKRLGAAGSQSAESNPMSWPQQHDTGDPSTGSCQGRIG